MKEEISTTLEKLVLEIIPFPKELLVWCKTHPDFLVALKNVQFKKFLGKELFGVVRTSFLIGKDGKIINIYENVKPALRAQEVLADLAKA